MVSAAITRTAAPYAGPFQVSAPRPAEFSVVDLRVFAALKSASPGQVILIFSSIGIMFVPIGAKCLQASRSARARSNLESPE